MRLSLAPGILIIALVGAAHAYAAERPSFDCAKAATATERTICANDRLARLDRSLATAYRRLGAELAVTGEVFANEQTAFLKQRDACGADVACLVRNMEERRAALALERQSKAGPEEAFVGRYRSSYGRIILRRTLNRDYEMTGQTSDPKGRWTCDISGKIKSVETGTATVEAGEDDNFAAAVSENQAGRAHRHRGRNTSPRRLHLRRQRIGRGRVPSHRAPQLIAGRPFNPTGRASE